MHFDVADRPAGVEPHGNHTTKRQFYVIITDKLRSDGAAKLLK
jgi:hypothetical protein